MANRIDKPLTYGDLLPKLLEKIAPPIPIPPGVDRVEMGFDPGYSDQMVARLHRVGRPVEVKSITMSEIDEHLRDAVLYGRGALQARVEPPLKKFSNAELVMEMLERGFAVMKLPADGGPPETLRRD